MEALIKLDQIGLTFERDGQSTEVLRDFSLEIPADAYLFVVSNWAPRVDVDLSPYANVLAYRKRVGSRPAVQAAMKAEGLIK